MRNDTPFLHLLLTPLGDESQQGVKGPPGLEGTDPLVILTFEEEVELGVGWSLALKGGSGQFLRGLRCRGDGIEGLAGEEGSAVHVGLDEGVGGMNSRGSQGLHEDRGVRHGGIVVYEGEYCL